MEKKSFNKVLIFDINPCNDEITKELIFGKILLAIKKACGYQHVVFLSHSNLTLLKKILTSMDIKNAYIISDAGARIFDAKNNKIIFQKPISTDAAAATIHTGIMENNLILVSGDTYEMSYSYNFSHQLSLSKKHYAKLPCTNEFQKFIKFVRENNIYSILIFNKGYEQMFMTYEKFTKLINEWSFELQKSISTYFLITEKNINKSFAVKYLIDYLKIPGNESIYYYALNTYDRELILTFKNRCVYQDVVLMSELRDKEYKFESDIASIIQSINKNSTN